MMKYAWLTDIHLNFLTEYERQNFYQSIIHSKAEAVWMSGDIAEAPSIQDMLLEMAHVLDKPIYFVLGNHDYYRGSVADVRAEITRLIQTTKHLKWLPESGPQTLSSDVLLLGVDGFADGRYGDYENSPVLLNDSFLISEFFQQKLLSRNHLLAKMQQFGDEDAKKLLRDIETGIETHNPKKIIILTHIPPFTEVCLYEGRQSDNNYLPFFLSKVTGDILLQTAHDYPSVEFTVLCGHTHHYAKRQISPNLTVTVGESKYYFPHIQEIISI